MEWFLSTLRLTTRRANLCDARFVEGILIGRPERLPGSLDAFWIHQEFRRESPPGGPGPAIRGTSFGEGRNRRRSLNNSAWVEAVVPGLPERLSATPPSAGRRPPSGFLDTSRNQRAVANDALGVVRCDSLDFCKGSLMATLTKAHQELYRRAPDEVFSSWDDLRNHCLREREVGVDRWQSPRCLRPTADGSRIMLYPGDDEPTAVNDWSFSQLCRLAGVGKDTVNRLTPSTACLAFQETLPAGDKPIQLLTGGGRVRSLHGTAYTRLWNDELLETIERTADGFEPPQRAARGGTGLYCGEQDLFAFLIDPLGWVEIGDQAFAPGFFVWNSEVGRRSLGIQTFWFQAVCQNHIVWDAVHVVEFTRKHTAQVRDGLDEIGRIIHRLVEQRDARRDGFAKVL